ncbi:hypothetical protein BG015_009605 [Linnemannia schmuckeri]|uniref:G domain-containing protein n=1 Tax=Linnemannia schmuckeri TaxID=64567 RepID=A0A9P5S5P3_9FUNG|nr:hypothetical protein BG015_009605 [Linnemannia schmuckeri]
MYDTIARSGGDQVPPPSEEEIEEYITMDLTITPPTTTATTAINSAVTTSAAPVHDYEVTKPLPNTPMGALQREMSGNLLEKALQVNKAVHEVNDWARPSSDFFKFTTTPMVNLAIVGNPGVGKSSILNALGGNFDHGYSAVSGLTTSVSKQQVTFSHIQLQLYDIPGIDDCSPDGNDSIVKHLQMVQDSLNEGGPFIILFVLKPTNGRIKPSDYMVMKTVIDSLREGPQVGIILTHAIPRDIHHYRSQHYAKMMLDKLEKIIEPRCKRFVSRGPPLVLTDHDANGFSEEEKQMILNFILSFDPKRVESRNMVEQIVRSFFAMANSGFA